MGPMDCNTVADRVAGYLDGELSKSELLLLEQHLERCSSCQALIEGVARMEITPPPPSLETSSPLFWRRMDVQLQAELALSERPAVAPSAGWRRWTHSQLRVNTPLMLGYAALLLFSVLWGVQNLRRAHVAEAQIESYVQQQQQAPTLQQPVAPSAVEQNQLRVATYSTHRGHL